MSGNQDVTYTIDFRVGKSAVRQLPASDVISRIARLMALAIRFEGLVNDGTVRDYADLARRGHVTRARMTQIMKLLHLAPDIQEQILFLPPVDGLNERNLRSIVRQTDWTVQRRMFHQITVGLELRKCRAPFAFRSSSRPPLSMSEGAKSHSPSLRLKGCVVHD
jgi:hypothetical protein